MYLVTRGNVHLNHCKQKHIIYIFFVQMINIIQGTTKHIVFDIVKMTKNKLYLKTDVTDLRSLGFIVPIGNFSLI